MVIVWGSVEVAEDRVGEVLRLSLEHVHRSRKEPGCMRHDVHVDAENPGRIVFFEEWEHQSALRTHFAVAESRRFVEEVRRLALRPPEMRVFEASPVA